MSLRTVLLGLCLLGLAGWWFLVGGRLLDEQQVRAFYADHEAATLARQPEALCAMLDDHFESIGVVSGPGVRTPQRLDQAQTCRGLRELYTSWERLGEQMGGLLQLDSRYTLHTITVAPDGRSATVQLSTTLDVGGSLMHLDSHTTDTLVRRNGVVKLLRSEGTGSVGVGR